MEDLTFTWHGQILDTEEAVLDAVRRGLSVWKIPFAFRNEQFLTKIIQADGMLLSKVPEGMRTPAMCLEAVRQEPYAVRFVRRRELQSERLYLEAVARNPYVLEIVPGRYLTRGMRLTAADTAFETGGRCLLSLAQRQKAPGLRLVPEVYLEAVRGDPGIFSEPACSPESAIHNMFEGLVGEARDSAVEAFRKQLAAAAEQSRRRSESCSSAPDLAGMPEQERTPDLCLAAVRQNGRALRFVPAALRTEELCAEAVRTSGQALRWTPEQFRTPDICIEAVRRNPLALGTVPRKLRTPELCMEAVRRLAWTIALVPKASLDKNLCTEAANAMGIRALFLFPEFFHAMSVLEAAAWHDGIPIGKIRHELRKLINASPLDGRRGLNRHLGGSFFDFPAAVVLDGKMPDLD